MTFFGYGVSDLTRSWLLYQGILFVLVMMFIPTGLAGLFQRLSDIWKTYGVARPLPAMALAFVAGVLLLCGTIFLVEMLQRFFSHDYWSQAKASTAGWPAISLFGLSWIPTSWFTWAVPVALFAVGSYLTRLARSRWLALIETDPTKNSEDESIEVEDEPQLAESANAKLRPAVGTDEAQAMPTRANNDHQRRPI
jgi:branched-chain amino acid transport system permease protein